MILSSFLIYLGLILILIAILGINLYVNPMKKAHCFSLASNCGFVFFVFGIAIHLDKISMAVLSSIFLFSTTPMLSSLLGDFISKEENIKEVLLQ